MKNIQIFYGKPVTEPCLVPVLHASTPTCINEPFMLNSVCHRVTALSFGTPHGAVFVDDIEAVDIAALGGALGTHPLFPIGASIVFAEVTGDGAIKAKLWQMGEGVKEVTPEAVCVAGVAAMMNQKTLKSVVNVTMGGNCYSVRWDRGKGVSLCEIPEYIDIRLVNLKACV